MAVKTDAKSLNELYGGLEALQYLPRLVAALAKGVATVEHAEDGSFVAFVRDSIPIEEADLSARAELFEAELDGERGLAFVSTYDPEVNILTEYEGEFEELA